MSKSVSAVCKVRGRPFGSLRFLESTVWVISLKFYLQFSAVKCEVCPSLRVSLSGTVLESAGWEWANTPGSERPTRNRSPWKADQGCRCNKGVIGVPAGATWGVSQWLPGVPQSVQSQIHLPSFLIGPFNILDNKIVCLLSERDDVDVPHLKI